MDTRSGFKNRSNRRPYRSGSKSVIVSAHATTEPAPEPRPGPTGIPLFFGPANEIGNDEEVTREAHIFDHVELKIEALKIGLARLRQLNRFEPLL